MDTQSDSSSDPQLEFPLQLSRFVRDIQRKPPAFLSLQNTVLEAIVWMRELSVCFVPVIVSDTDRPTLASLQAIDAKTLLQVLLERQGDDGFRFQDFFEIPLSEFSYRRVPIVYPEMDLVAVIRRMYNERRDLLLVFEGIRLSGLVTAGDVFDAMIGAAVLDNALFNTDLPAKGSVMENARMCCLKQKISRLFNPGPVHQLNTHNTVLTAVRVLLTQSPSHVLLSDHSQHRHQLIVAENMLSALLARLESAPPETPLKAELMNRLEVLFDVHSPPLKPDDSVFEAVQAIHFNNLTCAAVMSDQQQLEGVITTNSLLKAFLDSIEHAFQMRRD